MANQTLQIIRETEQKAADIRSDAVSRSEQMVSDARRAGKEKFSRTERKTKEENRAMLEKIRSEANRLIERSRTESEANCDSVSEASGDAKQKAADLIIRRMIEKCQ